MPTTPRRTFALVAGALVLLVAAAVGYLLLLPRQTGDVAVPPPDATPEQVVTAYVGALNAHDCDTAEAVMAEGAKDSGRSWCDDVARLTHVDVHDHFTESESDHAVVVNVPVTFDLTWRPFHDDGSMDEGATTWGYRLVRDSEHSPWRIFDQGTG